MTDDLLRQLDAARERVRAALADAPALAAFPAGLERLARERSIGASPSPSEVARRIDHTLLRADATRADVLRLCDEARAHTFASVCVNSSWVPACVERLAGSGVMTICVVGFPLGAASMAGKAAETAAAVAAGAEEIDTVVPLGLLKGGELAAVAADLRAVTVAAAGRPVKVILETHLLDTAQKIEACLLAVHAGATFVKTSTGFSGGAATADDVALLRAVVGPELGVKASGGVRTLDDARRMLAAGADRIGASASVAIATGAVGGGGY